MSGRRYSRKEQSFYRPSSPKPPAAPIPHIFISIFTARERHHWICPELAMELVRIAFGAAGGAYRVTFGPPIFGVYPVSAARNLAVEKHFLSTDADIHVMFDNDIGPAPRILDGILSLPTDAAIGVFPYWVWDPQQLRPALCFGQWIDKDGKKQMLSGDYKGSGWHPGGAGGTGAICIRRAAYDLLEKPYFRILHSDYEGQTMSEDIWFTHKVHEAGGKVMMTTDYVCSHYHTLDLAEINLGMNAVCRKYVEKVREAYGEHGIEVPKLNEMLAGQGKK